MMKNSPAIAAVFELPPGRYPDDTSMGLYRKVLKGVLSRSGLKSSEINGLMLPPADMTSDTPDVLMHEKFLDELGIKSVLSETMFAGGASYGLMIQRAALAIAEGRADVVLCAGAGKYPKLDAAGRRSMSKIFQSEFELPYGPSIPAMYALLATRHMAEFGTTPEQIAQVAVTTREWAMKNPNAFMRKKGELTVAQVLASPLVASPYHLLDCSVPCEGGGAIIVASGEFAKRISARPAYLKGMGEFHSHGYQSQAGIFNASLGARHSGQQAFRMAGLSPHDIDIVEVYDAFTFMTMVCLEDLGFCKKGEGGEFISSETTRPGGDLPVNTYGGLLSYGHVGDASGLSMIVEGCLQVMGQAGDRQIENTSTALVHAYGGMQADHSTLIFSSEA